MFLLIEKKRRKCIQKLDKNIIIDNLDKNKINKKKEMNLLIFQNLTFQIMVKIFIKTSRWKFMNLKVNFHKIIQFIF